MAKVRETLGQAHDVTSDEDIGRGESGDVRSRYFINLWEKLPMEAEVRTARTPQADGGRS